MSVVSSSTRHARRLSFVTTALLAWSSTGAAQTAGVAPDSAPATLPAFITVATRTPAAPQTVGSAVQVISAADLAAEQVTTLSGALALAAGGVPLSSGGRGASTSLFLRGANSNQTLFLVDGIRLNDPNTEYQVFLGGAALGPGDHLEVLRGSQSTLYGAEAIGGVVVLESARGSGGPSASVALEGGSFGTVHGALAAQGERGGKAWSVAVNGEHTDNERPNNRFNAANVALRLDRAVTPRLAVGATLRWFDGAFGSPGDRFTNDPNDRERESNLLGTVFADAKLAADWTAHVTLGGQDRRYVADTPAPNLYGTPSARTVKTNRRGVLDAQSTYTGVARHRLTAGFTAEANASRSNGFGAIDRNQQLFAVFAEDEVALADHLTLTGGLRNDHVDTFGHATTGRATIAWLALPDRLKLRASYGTGFRAPSFLDLYGRDTFFVGNSQLRPERSRSVDAGVDYYLPDHRGVLSATWFETNLRDLIEYAFAVYPDPSTEVNVGRARTRGIELSARARLPRAVDATLSYTYLDAFSLDPAGHTRLLRRPRNALVLDVHRVVARCTVGAAAQYVGRRADVDALTYAVTTQGGYAVVRAYASWQATPALTVKLRVENALDRQYEPVNGYPALGRAVFGGVEYRF